jgi:hypothetical protein
MTNSIVARLDMDFQDTKDFRMDLKFTDKIESMAWKMIRDVTIRCSRGKLFLETDFIFESMTHSQLCDFAALLFERDREDMLGIYDNNDIHGLYEASLLTIKAKTDEDLLKASNQFKKVLLSHYLKEIKAFIAYYNDEYFLSYLSDNEISTSIDQNTGEVCHFGRFGHQLAI